MIRNSSAQTSPHPFPSRACEAIEVQQVFHPKAPTLSLRFYSRPPADLTWFEPPRKVDSALLELRLPPAGRRQYKNYGEARWPLCSRCLCFQSAVAAFRSPCFAVVFLSFLLWERGKWEKGLEGALVFVNGWQPGTAVTRALCGARFPFPPCIAS